MAEFGSHALPVRIWNGVSSDIVDGTTSEQNTYQSYKCCELAACQHQHALFGVKVMSSNYGGRYEMRENCHWDYSNYQKTHVCQNIRVDINIIRNKKFALPICKYYQFIIDGFLFAIRTDVKFQFTLKRVIDEKTKW